MNDNNLTKTTWDTIVIGGGQAGLVTGYHLKQLNEDFIILDANAATGDSWRNRWDSLRLFTPNWLNRLPGMLFQEAQEFPSKDEVADYLTNYKRCFDLPVHNNCEVIGLYKTPACFEIKTTGGKFYANSVIIATGDYVKSKIPAFAKELNKSINQLHSSGYKNASQLPAGDVLVVGAGTSGLQIAADIIKVKRNVYVAGNPPGHIPDLIFKYFAKQFVWFATNILTVKTPMGRKAQYALKVKGQAAPLISITLKDVTGAGAKHVARIAGTKDGWPVSENGDVIKATNIIWATGFAPDYSWVKLKNCFDEQGYPLTGRGIAYNADGLYFVGSLFQYGLTSTWLGGVGRDAEFVCRDAASFNKKKLGVLV